MPTLSFTVRDAYCAKASSVSDAILSRAHNDANVIALSEEMPEELMLEVVNKFIETPFSNVNKYIRRNNIIKEIEND